MAASVVPAPLENIGEAGQVGIHIGMWMIDRITHAGLCRQMRHGLETAIVEQRGDGLAIRKIDAHEIEARILPQDVQPRLLQRRVVIAVEIVETHDVPALSQQLAADVKADKSRRTRDQNCAIRHRVPDGPGEGQCPPAGSL